MHNKHAAAAAAAEPANLPELEAGRTCPLRREERRGRKREKGEEMDVESFLSVALSLSLSVWLGARVPKARKRSFKSNSTSSSSYRWTGLTGSVTIFSKSFFTQCSCKNTQVRIYKVETVSIQRSLFYIYYLQVYIKCMPMNEMRAFSFYFFPWLAASFKGQ